MTRTLTARSMEQENLHNLLGTFIRSRLGHGSRDVELDVARLRGGLESSSVLDVKVRFRTAQHKHGSFRFVVKRLSGPPAREAHIYEELLARSGHGFSPGLLGVERSDGESRLYLEAVRPVKRWPWSEMENATRVMELLAELHHRLPAYANRPWEWDYEEELRLSCEEMLGILENRCWQQMLPSARQSLRSVRRMTSNLAAWRRQLLDYQPYGQTLIHGDVHSGNIVLKKSVGTHRPVLLDWGRLRVGSPLEDVSSWLQSLGYWEPQVRRYHDTLLTSYLAARGHSAKLSRDFREAYWLAAASNALAGALKYHLMVVNDPVQPEKRRQGALLMANDCLRVLRRADACWTSG